MELKNASEIINEIEKTRLEINKIKALIANSNFRLSQNKDEMWINIKKEQELKLEQSTKKLETLYEEFSLQKNELSDFYWRLNLEILGFVIAKTENINNIENSMHDEFELKKAIDQTELSMGKYYGLLKEKKDNPDASAVINSALKTFAADMKNHYWAEERLRHIQDIYEEKNEDYFKSR